MFTTGILFGMMLLVLLVGYQMYSSIGMEDKIEELEEKLKYKVELDSDYVKRDRALDRFLGTYGLDSEDSLWDIQNLQEMVNIRKGKKPVHRREVADIDNKIDELNERIKLLERAIKDKKVMDTIQEKVKVEKSIESLVEKLNRMEDSLK